MKGENVCDYIVLCIFPGQSPPSFSHSFLHLSLFWYLHLDLSFTTNLKKVRAAIFLSTPIFCTVWPPKVGSLPHTAERKESGQHRRGGQSKEQAAGSSISPD